MGRSKIEKLPPIDVRSIGYVSATVDIAHTREKKLFFVGKLAHRSDFYWLSFEIFSRDDTSIIKIIDWRL